MTNVTREQRRQVFEKMIGKVVAGKYTITGLLGFGGMGAVYEAIQSSMERKVALKLIPTYDPTATTRFAREATTVSKLTHPNTVTVFDYGHTDDGHLFLSMEYLVGRTLTDLIRERGPLPAEQIVHIATQICRALGEAHRMGIIHRDIKPDNIFLIQVDRDPLYVKVLDFGIAKAVHGEPEADLTADGRIVGTPRYMSPEQILGQPIDHRVDIYSLGCILFEMACGAPPFGGNNTAALMMSHAQQPPPTFSSRLTPDQLKTIPAGLEAVIQRTLAKNPNARPQNTEVLRHELEQALRINQAYQAAHMPQNTGNHAQPQQQPPGATSNNFIAAHTGQNLRPPTGQFEPGGFEHHTGDFSHQTGNFQHQQQQQQQFTGQHTFGNPTGTHTGFSAPPPVAQKKNKAPLILIGVTLIALIGLGAAYMVQEKNRQAQNPEQPSPNPTAIATAPPKAQEVDPQEDKGETPPTEVATKETAPIKFRVRSEPEADILSGGQFIATTPHTIALKPDEEARTYTIRLDGYKEEVITVDPSKPEENYFEIKLVSLKSKKRANIRVSKDPEDKPAARDNKTTSPAEPKNTVPDKVDPPTKPIDRLNDNKENVVERLD